MALRSQAPAHNLPAQPLRLIGRGTHLRAIRARLLQPDVRLFTLAGPPGSGKTRLAIEGAAGVVDRFKDGARFVDLSPVTDSALVVSAIAQALRVGEFGAAPLPDTLRQVLRGRTMLLLLDNFEHVLAAAPMLSDLLAACPNLTLLVTSREPLRLRWEHLYPVPPLAVPDLTRLQPPSELALVPAVALFLERVRALNPHYRLNAGDAPAVAELCVRLDGLPLAIELAAARPDAAHPAGLVRHLQDAGTLTLEAGSRDQPERHQTLARAIDRSYELLTAEEQLVFRRLAVFPGGCTVEAAAAVCSPGESWSTSRVDRVLVDLARKHLIQIREAPEQPARFALLQILRDYALQRLEEVGETDAIQRRLAEHYIASAAAARGALLGPHQAPVVERFFTELDNLRSVLDWALAHGEAEMGLRLTADLDGLWNARGLWSEARRRLASLLALPAATPPTRWRARALRAAATFAILQSDHSAARTLLEESLALSRRLRDTQLALEAELAIATVAYQQGDGARAEPIWRKYLVRFRRAGDARSTGWMLYNLGLLARDREDRIRAAHLFDQSIAQFRRAGALGRLALALETLAELEVDAGHLARAAELVEESTELRRAVGGQRGTLEIDISLAMIALARGDLRSAAARTAAALEECASLGRPRAAIRCLEIAAGVLAAAGEHAPAARYLGAAGVERHALGAAPTPFQRRLQDHIRHAIHDALGDAAAQDQRHIGESTPPEQIAAEALPTLRALTLKLPQPSAATTRRPVKSSLATGSPSLSRREREVAALVARGYTNREVAQSLVISERTAANHIHRILLKLGLHTRTQLAAWTMQHT